MYTHALLYAYLEIFALWENQMLTPLHSERPKLCRVLAVLSAIGFKHFDTLQNSNEISKLLIQSLCLTNAKTLIFLSVLSTTLWRQVMPWVCHLYKEIIHKLKPVDYLPYRQTNHGITLLYHPPLCRPCTLPRISLSSTLESTQMWCQFVSE